jgi:hypothetical protein
MDLKTGNYYSSFGVGAEVAAVWHFIGSGCAGTDPGLMERI